MNTAELLVYSGIFAVGAAGFVLLIWINRATYSERDTPEDRE